MRLHSVHIFIFLLLTLPAHLFSQEKYAQVIRGTIIDKITRLPLPGANVVLMNTDIPQGISTDANGVFRLENIPVGRQNIRVSFMGYQEQTISNLNITTGKELILTIELEENIIQMKEVVVKPEERKDLPANKMAVVSARSFTIEETERFAGSVGDPSRMASGFAGVSTLSDQQNEIVIRGNSPMGLLWRLDGVDIPNPNHFGALGTTGGGISMINNNTLANSDFFTGAFPAEYGDALSGVFDLKMRSGNDEHHEFTAQLGFNGLEFGGEGPLSKKDRSSYLFNYRYSALVLIDQIIGTEALSVSAVPFYHDLSFKVNFPTKNYGRFSVTGLGGISGINENESDKDPGEWSNKYQGSDYQFGTRMGTVIASHTYYFNPTTRLESFLSFSGVNSLVKEDTFTVVNLQPSPLRRQNAWQVVSQLGMSIHKKLDVKNFFDIGAIYQFMLYDYLDKTAHAGIEPQPIIDVSGSFNYLKAYMQWQHRFNDQLVLNAGMSSLFFLYNLNLSADPRLSLKWQINARHSLGIGTGIYSQLPEEMFYLVETPLNDGSVIMTNKNMGYMKSFHFVPAYDFLMTDNLRLKIEAYYQRLFNIPVRSTEPAWSMLNFGADSFSAMPVVDSLVNRGTGTNYGIELSVEHFLRKGFYFLFTSSLFKSTYEGYDQVRRNTAFDNNFVLNLLAGKEFRIKEKNFLTIDLRATWAGGNRYVPFYTVKVSDYYYIKIDDWEHAYEQRRPDYFRLNLRIGFKVNFRKATGEIAFDLLNLTNQKNIYFEFYDPSTGEIKTVYQLPFIPVALIRVQF